MPRRVADAHLPRNDAHLRGAVAALIDPRVGRRGVDVQGEPGRYRRRYRPEAGLGSSGGRIVLQHPCAGRGRDQVTRHGQVPHHSSRRFVANRRPRTGLSSQARLVISLRSKNRAPFRSPRWTRRHSASLSSNGVRWVNGSVTSSFRYVPAAGRRHLRPHRTLAQPLQRSRGKRASRLEVPLRPQVRFPHRTIRSGFHRQIPARCQASDAAARERLAASRSVPRLQGQWATRRSRSSLQAALGAHGAVPKCRPSNPTGFQPRERRVRRRSARPRRRSSRAQRVGQQVPLLRREDARSPAADWRHGRTPGTAWHTLSPPDRIPRPADNHRELGSAGTSTPGVRHTRTDSPQGLLPHGTRPVVPRRTRNRQVRSGRHAVRVSEPDP